ncbi:MAG TPA: zf-TFIIB domain-containing protein [Planctomycetaceae bacterium]|nr:zf-TFIIB domain-containing protein [Planctomycetaceae bacterium]
MPKTLACPKCQSWLQDLEPDRKKCPTCEGVFVHGSETRRMLLDDVGDYQSDNETSYLCPDCNTELCEGILAGSPLYYCPQCWGTWLSQGELAPSEESGRSFSLGRALLYGISIPERALRSTVGLAAGTISGTAAFLIPQCFQSSKTYEIVVKNSLRLLSEGVAGVESKKDASDPGIENYVARKTVGNFVDLAGIMTLHLSPLWLLAIVSDVAYGTKSYVIELAKELEREGVIDDSSTIHKIDDLLAAIQKSTGSAATLFDTPPLSKEELKRTLQETRDSLSEADVTSLLPEAEIEKYWSELKQLSQEEGVSLLGLSGAVSLHTLRKVGAVGQGSLSGVRVAGGLFNRHILGHYAEAVTEYRERGFYESLQTDSEPYIKAMWNNFSPERATWTEELISGRTIGRLFGRIGKFFRKPPIEETTETEPVDKISPQSEA